MSQLPAKFGTLWLRTNGLTGTDGYLQSSSQKAGLGGVLYLLYDTVTHLLCIYYLLFFLFPFPGFYNGIKKPQILFPLWTFGGLSFSSDGSLGSSWKILFPEVSHFFLHLSPSRKSAKHFKLKLPKRVKVIFSKDLHFFIYLICDV